MAPWTSSAPLGDSVRIRPDMNADGVIHLKGPVPTIIARCVGTVKSRNARQASVPNTATESAATRMTTAAAAANAPHRRPDASATGNWNPNCGLNPRSPKSAPETSGLVSTRAKPASSSAAVMKPFWPRTRFVATAGESMSSQSSTLRPRKARAEKNSAASPTPHHAA